MLRQANATKNSSRNRPTGDLHVHPILSPFLSLHCPPRFLIHHTTPVPVAARIASPVNIHPFPSARISGSPSTLPTQEKMLRRKLATATPELGLRGMNSVSIVTASEKMS